jgi:hypothetical protein
MKAQVGDEIQIDSERAGEPARVGEILEIIEAAYGTSYRVHWNDGHESVIHPMAGTVRIRAKSEARA